MRSIPLEMLLKKAITYSVFIAFIGLILLGCSSTKKNKQKTILSVSDQHAAQVQSSKGNTATVAHLFGFDNHEYTSLRPALKTSTLSNDKDSLAQSGTGTAANEIVSRDSLDSKNTVAEKILRRSTYFV